VGGKDSKVWKINIFSISMLSFQSAVDIKSIGIFMVSLNNPEVIGKASEKFK
jgi:hypothetical protein